MQVGEVVNLMSVDVQKFMDLLPYVNILWSSLLQIGLSTFFIYQELGWPAFVGVTNRKPFTPLLNVGLT